MPHAIAARMQPVDCNVSQSLVHRAIDGELSDNVGAELSRHVAGCATCQDIYGRQRTLKHAIRSQATRHAAPAALGARIGAALDAQTARSSGGSWLNWRPYALAASLALAVMTSSLATWYVVTPERADAVQQEVIASHIRSLMEGHLTDIESSDRHTVKPWFNGRVDLSPPVKDLAAEGFPLVGGRLDYIGGRPVAALVYKRRQHIINAFIWPDSAPADMTATSERGFNLRSWTQNGMTLWVISDLNAAELATFEQALRKD
jgi:anti-sigma factor RsiW